MIQVVFVMSVLYSFSWTSNAHNSGELFIAICNYKMNNVNNPNKHDVRKLCSASVSAVRQLDQCSVNSVACGGPLLPTSVSAPVSAWEWSHVCTQYGDLTL